MTETPHFTPNTAPTAEAVILQLAGSPEFQEARSDGYNISRALARTALSFTGMNAESRGARRQNFEDDYEPNDAETTRDQAIFAVAGTLPSFVHGLEGIRHHHEVGYLDRSTYTSLKGRAARFNHAIKSLAEQDPSLTTDDITTMVVDMYGVLNRERWGDDRQGFANESAWFEKQVTMSLRGMQQEIVARQVIEAAAKSRSKDNAPTPRLSVDPHVSVEDDLHGADLYVTLDGVTFPVDVKASERTANNVRRRSHSPQSIITSGVPTYKLHGSFTADELSVRRATPFMLKQLYAARSEFIAQHASSSGRQTQSA